MPSPPPLRWAELATRRVGVWGLGVEGRATTALLAARGHPAAVLVDDRPGDGVLATDAGGLDALAGCEVVVKSPGISRRSTGVARLEAAGVAVVGGLGLWLEEVGTEHVIGVTGTKGKSTTTSVAAHLARGLGVRAAAVGNLGTPPWAPDAPAAGDVELWVVEVSSYQATDLWSSPAVVVVTSLHEDHLDWHGGFEAYAADKLSLAGRPGARVTLANGGDPRLRAHEELLRPGPRWIDAAELDAGAVGWTSYLGLRGAHNTTNALLAAAALAEAEVPGAHDVERLAEAAQGYAPLPHRLQTVAVLDGVEYVDDSLSTNVLPTLVAAEVFAGRPLALIVGGHDRGIDYAPLGAYTAARPDPTLVLAVPDNGPVVAAAVRAAGGDATVCDDLADAVARAAAWAPPGGVVLLSPAAASYGRFSGHVARAEAFRAAVEGLRPEGSSA